MIDKKFSDEMLKKYISSEISLIQQEKENKENWKMNDEYHSQIEVRLVRSDE